MSATGLFPSLMFNHIRNITQYNIAEEVAHVLAAQN
jgi:hypothetical protein